MEQKTMEQKVTKDMTIGEVVRKYPAAAEVMTNYGLHCVGCHVNQFESIGEGAMGHGMPEATVDEMIDKINAVLDTSGSEEKIEITAAAALKIAELSKKEGKEGHALRIKVMPGGCSGYSYDMHFDDQTSDSDKKFEKDGISVVVDTDSMGYLKGTTVDYVESLQGAGFKLVNPNAKSACGCGSSVGF